MTDQTTIEDMNSFVDALRYSQTLVNTAQAGADLSYDFLASYDYYGTVSMAVSPSTKIEASVISLTGYDTNKFFQYTQAKMENVFYKVDDVPYGAIHIVPVTMGSDLSLLTDQTILDSSILINGSITATYMAYGGAVSFDDDDIPQTLVPLSRLDGKFFRQGDIVPLDSDLWEYRVSFGGGSILSHSGSSVFQFSGLNIVSGINSGEITFSSADDDADIILRGTVGPSMEISTSAVLSEETEAGSNLFTMNKLNSLEYKKAGDQIELHLSDGFTDDEIKSKVDVFMSSSGSSPVYNGEDTFLNKEQSLMVAEYIYRKVTGIQKAAVSM